MISYFLFTRRSVTFDPYLTLSLPIPVQTTRDIDVIFHIMPHSDGRPLLTKYRFELQHVSTDNHITFEVSTARPQRHIDFFTFFKSSISLDCNT
jgi:hypothetical protein